MKLKLVVSLIGAACMLAGLTLEARAQGLVDPSRSGYLDAFKGKKVAFVPIAMGFDLAQAWNSQLAKQAQELGYSYVVRDPNWSTEAGAQALTQLIADAMGQGRDLNTLIKTLFEVKPKPGTMKVIDYSPLTVLTKDTLNPDSCWALPTTTASK
jgi:hypothetical protein